MFRIRVDDSMLHGSVEPGFEEVETEFRRNFSERDESGAACAVYHAGKKIVDLWGGYRDRKTRSPWAEDTMVLVFSVTKGISSMTIALAHSRGLLDYDEKISTYWPEFAQEGKENITVRQLLAHQAGLCAIDERLNAEKIGDLDGLAAILARQKPAWEPGTKHGYHAVSLGWYEGELIRRVDPQHRSLGQFFQDEIAKPLGLEFYIGLPPDVPDSRMAILRLAGPIYVLRNLKKVPWSFYMKFITPWSLTVRAFNNPKVCSPTKYGGPKFRYVEIPAANGIGQVRDIAKAYSVFATGGSELGIKKETMEALTMAAIPPTQGLHDKVTGVNWSFSLGYTRPFKDFNFGSSGKAFGMTGIGGSFAYADPDAQISFAYASHRIGFYRRDDPREKAMRDALYRCL